MHMDSSAGPGAPFTPQAISPSDDPQRRDQGADQGRLRDADYHLPARLAALIAENHELRAEVERLRAERTRMADIQTRLMDVLGCKSADRLVHDVRNVLNERELYRALADATAE